MDDFFDMDPFELAFALGMAETIAEEEIERFRIEREFDKDDDDFLDEQTHRYFSLDKIDMTGDLFMKQSGLTPKRTYWELQ